MVRRLVLGFDALTGDAANRACGRYGNRNAMVLCRAAGETDAATMAPADIWEDVSPDRCETAQGDYPSNTHLLAAPRDIKRITG